MWMDQLFFVTEEKPLMYKLILLVGIIFHKDVKMTFKKM